MARERSGAAWIFRTPLSTDAGLSLGGESSREAKVSLAKQLRHCWLAFTELKRSRARIVSTRFGNEGAERSRAGG
jgi:uncharacterized DUF497 family protein